MSKDKGKTSDVIERLKREQEAAREKAGQEKIASQLTHESTGKPDFSELAKKLKERQAEEKVPALANTVKFTIYVDEDIASAFQALCVRRGDQRKYATQAFADFVEKKAKELGL